MSRLRTAAALRGHDTAALEQRPPYPGARTLDLDRITFYSRGGLRIGTARGALAQGRGTGRRVPPEPRQRPRQAAHRPHA